MKLTSLNSFADEMVVGLGGKAGGLVDKAKDLFNKGGSSGGNNDNSNY